MNVITEICKSFDKVSSQYEKNAKIQKEIGERLFQRLALLNINPRYILDVGCASGYFSERLMQQYPKAIVVGLDLADGMLRLASRQIACPLVRGDMLSLPFLSHCFDLIFANQVLHWSPSMPKVLRELHRVLTTSGCVMFSTLGPDTFLELRQAWALVDEYQHVNAFMDMHNLGDCLLSEYFLDPVVDREEIQAQYVSISNLLQSLKSQGVRNIHQKRSKGLTGKDTWQRFEEAFGAFCTSEGRFPLTYEVIYGHAWKGETAHFEGGIETRIDVSSLRNKKINYTY